MNTKTLMQYDNRKKSKTTAYLLGALSMFIPLAFHKFYLGHKDWAALYIVIFITYLLTLGSAIGLLFSLIYSVLMLVDVVKTSFDVDKHNNNLIEELGGLDE